MLCTDAIHNDALSLLARHALPVMFGGGGDDDLRNAVSDVRALIVRRRLPDDIVECAPKLALMVRHGVGVDLIPVERATAAGIPVANVPGANVDAVVEHVIGVMLSLLRGFTGLDRDLRGGLWEHHGRYGGRELRGSTVGVVGLGRIGTRLASILSSGFGCRVIGCVRDPSIKRDVDCVPLNALLEASDHVVLSLPLTADTHRLLDASALAHMRPHATLINVSRGAVIDESALVAVLRERRIAGAALDVFVNEPISPGNPLLSLDNVLLTPHSAGITGESHRRTGIAAVEEVLRMLRGERPVNLVNPEAYTSKSGRGAQ